MAGETPDASCGARRGASARSSVRSIAVSGRTTKRAGLRLTGASPQPSLSTDRASAGWRWAWWQARSPGRMGQTRRERASSVALGAPSAAASSGGRERQSRPTTLAMARAGDGAVARAGDGAEAGCAAAAAERTAAAV
eukprot:4581499-Pleurochrysis_carterae.AAC.2